MVCEFICSVRQLRMRSQVINITIQSTDFPCDLKVKEEDQSESSTHHQQPTYYLKISFYTSTVFFLCIVDYQNTFLIINV